MIYLNYDELGYQNSNGIVLIADIYLDCEPVKVTGPSRDSRESSTSYERRLFMLSLLPQKPDWSISAPDEMQFMKKDLSLQLCLMDPCYKFSKWFLTENMFDLLLLNMEIQRTETEIESAETSLWNFYFWNYVLQVNLIMVGFLP